MVEASIATVYKVIVKRESIVENSSSWSWWLWKQIDGGWKLCRRDNSTDAAAFQAAGAIKWRNFREGEYDLDGTSNLGPLGLALSLA